MISVTFYNFSKQVNSTARPSTNGVTVSCLLKVSTSTFNPTFVLDVTTDDVWNYTYTVWGSYYYYVVDKRRITNDIYEIDCEIDVLATWKTQIIATSAFVKYSTNSYDTDIPDLRLSTKKDVTITSTTGTIFNNEGCYFVSFVGTNTNTKLIITSSNDFNDLTRQVMTDEYYDSLVVTLGNYVSKRLNSAIESLLEAHYLPITPDLGGSMQINLGGGYATGISGHATDHETVSSCTIDIPWHYSDFRNRSEYTSILLYLPCYGVLELNPDDFLGQESITINASFDPYNGDISYRIGTRIKCSCNCAVPVQIGLMQNGSFTGTVNSIGSLMSLASPNLASSIVNGFGTILSSLQHNVGSVGSNGGASNWNIYSSVACVVMSHNTTVEPSTMASRQGRPLNRVISMPSSGYVETTNFSVNCNAPNNLKEQINSLMNGGVYIE